MKLSDLCLRRPVLAIVMNLMVLLIGIIAMGRLDIREYPNIDPPVVTVQTDYIGADSWIVESQVTKPIEDAVAGIEGIETLSSISRFGQSQITILFTLKRDVEDAANDVRDRVSRIRGQLPEEIKEVVVTKTEADAQPILFLALGSDTISSLDITDYADRFIRNRLQNIDGVADIRIIGERRYAMRIEPDKARMAALGVTASDIKAALQRQNADFPSGLLEGETREFSVLAESSLEQVAQFENIILRSAESEIIRLKDIASIRVGPEDERMLVRYNGQPAVGIGIIKQSTANPLSVSKAVDDALPELSKELPEGMTLAKAYDKSTFISASLESVVKALIESLILVVAVIYIFLRSIKSTLVPVMTIPVSMIGACAFMLMAGFSINTLTLLSMVLAIGLVVDDAIVVLENIYRHRESGLSPFEAAQKGMNEIGFAVLAMTITLAAVFFPIGFLTGNSGRLFTEFAWTLALAVLVSGFAALTLSPVMCVYLLKKTSTHRTSWLEKLEARYQHTLQKSLQQRNRLLVGSATLALLIAAAGFYFIPKELAPLEDRGTIVTIYFAPEGSGLEYTDRYARQLESIFVAEKDIEKYFIIVGQPNVSRGVSFLRMKPWSDRDVTQFELAKRLAPKFSQVPGIVAFPVNPPSLGQSVRSKPVQFVIQSNASYAELDTMVSGFMDKIRDYPGLANMETDLKLNLPRLTVSINREKAYLLGIDSAEIADSLGILLGGREITRYKRGGEQYEVIIQLPRQERLSPSDLDSIFLRTKEGAMVQLSNLVNAEETVAPLELNRFNQFRAVKLTANLGAGYTLGQALEYLESEAEGYFKSDIKFDYDGESREFKKASGDILSLYVLALAFIFLVLAAQFESFKAPFIILLTVPLSAAGALLVMKLTGQTLNVFSQVGLITLVGLISKHGILITEFASQLREQGQSLQEAVIEATLLRFRPILMTTAATVLGALPLILESGAGAASRASIGWVIVSGMTLGTIFTLFVIPAAYMWMYRKEA